MKSMKGNRRDGCAIARYKRSIQEANGLQIMNYKHQERVPHTRKIERAYVTLGLDFGPEREVLHWNVVAVTDLEKFEA